MRNFFFLLLCVSMVSFASCGDDDDNGPTVSMADIVGNWNVTMLSSENEVVVANIGATTAYTTSNSTLTLTFNDDGSWTSGGAFTRTATLAGTPVDAMLNGIGSGTYTVNGGTVTLNGVENIGADIDNIPFRVEEFTTGSLLRLIADEDDIASILGIESGFRFDADMTLEQ